MIFFNIRCDPEKLFGAGLLKRPFRPPQIFSLSFQGFPRIMVNARLECGWVEGAGYAFRPSSGSTAFHNPGIDNRGYSCAWRSFPDRRPSGHLFPSFLPTELRQRWGSLFRCHIWGIQDSYTPPYFFWPRKMARLDKKAVFVGKMTESNISLRSGRIPSSESKSIARQVRSVKIEPNSLFSFSSFIFPYLFSLIHARGYNFSPSNKHTNRALTRRWT